MNEKQSRSLAELVALTRIVITCLENHSYNEDMGLYEVIPFDLMAVANHIKDITQPLIETILNEEIVPNTIEEKLAHLQAQLDVIKFQRGF